jgi:hypothetical protein
LAIEGRLIGDADEELGASAVTLPWHEHRRYGTTRVFFRVRLESQDAQPSGAVFGLLRRILR